MAGVGDSKAIKGKTQSMYIGSGLLALLAFLVLWLGFGHLLLGIIVALVILCVGGGIGFSGNRRV